MMKIGFVVPNFYPDMIGGAEWYLWDITQELAKLGHDLHIFTQFGPKGIKKEETVKNIRIHRLKSFGFFYRAKVWKGLISELKKYDLDIVIALDYGQRSTWQTLSYAKRKKIPALLIINDIHSLKIGRHPLKQIFMIIYDKYFARGIVNKANKILARTSYTKKQIIKMWGVKENKIEITPSGLTEEELRPGNALEFEKRFGIKGNIILFLGRIRKQKGAFLLLEAFEQVKRQVPEAKLVYVGPDPKEYDGLECIPILKGLAKQKNLKDVHFLGPLYGRNKINALSACDIMCLPSSFENFGQAYSQAFAQGKPVIGTTGGGIPDIIDQGQDGFMIEPWNKKQLVEYLVKLLKDKDLRDKMGKFGKEKIQNYRYDRLAKQMEEICLKEIKKL